MSVWDVSVWGVWGVSVWGVWGVSVWGVSVSECMPTSLHMCAISAKWLSPDGLP